jgi:Ulp1 protease family, C-terminal catalytic domain/MULE transposase domain
MRAFPKSLVEEINLKISLGIGTKEISNSLINSKWARENRNGTVDINKIDHVSKRYVSQKKSKFKSAGYLHNDDATSTYMLVDNLSKERCNPVVLYKPYKKDLVFGNADVLRQHDKYDELFCLGLQTKEQADMLSKFGPMILCGDATHGLTAYGYQLFSLVVKDDTGRGFTVASLITSHVDKMVLSHFFQLLQERVPDTKITVSMSDDDEATKAAFRSGFGTDTNLLCQWHVPRAWQSNLARVDRKDNKEELMYLLKKAMWTRNKAEYFKIVQLILSEYGHNKEFVTYLSLYYFNRPEQWASSFRLFYHGNVDTNMLLEALHNVIKTAELERKLNWRVDTLVALLLAMEQNRFKSYCIAITNNVVAPIPDLTKRHVDGVKIPDSSVRLTSNGWEVASSKNNGVWYKVTEAAKICTLTHCYLSCLAPSCDGLCAHLLRCFCPDPDPLCKHVHKVQAFSRRNLIALMKAKISAAPAQAVKSAAPVQPVTSAAPVQPVTSAAPVQPVKSTAPVHTMSPATPMTESDEEDSKVNLQLLNQVNQKLKALEKLLQLPNSASTPVMILEAVNTKLEQCMQLVQSNVVKKLPRMQHSGSFKPNGRLVRQPTFKKKLKVPFVSAKKVAAAVSVNAKLTQVTKRPNSPATLTAVQPVAILQPKQTPVLPVTTQTAVQPVAILQPKQTPVLPVATQTAAKPKVTMSSVATPTSAPQTVRSTSKFAFLPPRPKFQGQLYGNLKAIDNLTQTLFEVKGKRVTHCVNHLTLKTLEHSPSFDDFQILSRHFDLQNKKFHSGWLIDTAIDTYLEIYCRNFPELQVLTCSEVLGLHIEREAPVVESRRAGTKLNPGATMLIMPYNEGNHWTLLIYDLVEDKFLFVDSLSASVPDISKMDEIKFRLEAWWGIKSQRGVAVKNIECAQQKDSKSCGIFVLHFVEILSLGQSFLTPCDPLKFRLKVFQTIIKDPGNCVD